MTSIDNGLRMDEGSRGKRQVWRLVLIGALASFSLAHAPASAQPAADLDASVASDGSQPKAAAKSSAVTSPSFSGAGRDLHPGEMDAARANALRDGAADLDRLRRAKPKAAGAGSVIGTDQRRRVMPTTRFPARATALILFDEGNSSFLCTGWLINKNTMVTAGHCVAEGGSGVFNDATTYKIYPGRDGSTSPYGSCNAKRLYAVGGWVNSNKDDFDYAAIKLDCDIGTTVGWYGITKSGFALDDKVVVQGYPGDEPSFTQWKAADKVRVLQKRRVFYQADTFGGQSGAPVWINKSANCNPCSIAIHAYGTYGHPPYSTNNHGARITETVFDNLVKWKNAP